ncbi:MAG: GNAT family N-acetyltransferase [Candidatus Kariarchaeum pelagius]
MIENDIKIRDPDIKDLEDIVHINRVCLPENYPIAYFIELIKSWQKTSCVALLNGRVVGYILMRVEGGFSTPWRMRSTKKGHIVSVAVLPDARRMGLGTMMMHNILKKANLIKNMEQITLEVRNSNYGAIKLYENLNFISEKIIKSYYSDGEDALLMKYLLE